jgi:purine-nucleoside phosphorylase
MAFEKASEAAASIKRITGIESHTIGVVLGSGLSEYARTLPDAVTVPYADIPGFPKLTVSGHAGSLVSAQFGPARGLVLAGRAHFYEGHDLDEVVLAVRAAGLAGCRAVLLTNAAGGINRSYSPGDLAVITDHLNLTNHSPLMGPNDDRFGPRFPDMSEVYSARLQSLTFDVAQTMPLGLRQGVYAWLTGPSYETPAEIRMLERLGADLVGMSTVPEAIALRHMDIEVLGISLVTNMAAGISGTPLSHDEVQETAAEAAARFAGLLHRLLPAMGSLLADSR